MLLVAALAGAMVWRVGWPPPETNLQSLLVVAPITFMALPFVFFGFGLYLRKPARSIVRSALFAESALFLVALAAAFWFRGFSSPRSVLVVGFLIHFIAVIGWRWGLQKTKHARASRVTVVATRDEAVAVVEKLLYEPSGWYEIVRVIEPGQLLAEGDVALVGSDMVVAGPSIVGRTRLVLLETAVRAGARVFIMPELSDILMVGSVAGQIGDAPVFEIRPLMLTGRQLVGKRVLDLSLSIPLLIMLLPVMAAVALAIKLFSPGPVFFTQKRVGLNGKEFVLYKFRTMVVDAEKRTGPVLATANDPRITPIGEFLRATRLDELPQLINVVRGEMSLVGPRPERPYFVDQFCRELPDYDLRHLTPPGITGLAQVMGRYYTSAQDKLRFDLYYIRHYSIWLDLKILLLTLQAVISRESATGVEASPTPQRMRAERLVLDRSGRVP
ncbi:sugar transferase [Symbiobacterium thermophilum]|nr:sugar transferase [Symbiobacterium thermophilum]